MPRNSCLFPLIVTGLLMAQGPGFARDDQEKTSVERQERAPQYQDDTPALKLPRAEVERLIKALDAKDFQVRLAATRTLQQAGPEVIRDLEKAARGQSLEVISRCISLLRRQYIRQQHDDQSNAEEALENLAEQGGKQTAAAALAVLEENSDLRDRRALEAVRQLGGIVKFTDSQQVIVGPGNVPVRQFSTGRAVSYILLGTDWKGGNQGIKYLRRLSSLNTLYIIDGTQIKDRELDGLYDRFPGLRVQRRGRAYLGIGSDRAPVDGNGCLVTRLEPGKAAQKSGILLGDVIDQFDGNPINSFDDLIAALRPCKANEEITVGIRRNGVSMEINVTLGKWEP